MIERWLLAQGWLTKAQIRDLYKDDVVADALIEKCKERPGASKPHRDLPLCPEAMLYNVMIAETENRDTTRERQRSMAFEGEVDSQSASLIRSSFSLLDSPSDPNAAPSSGSGGIAGSGGNVHDDQAQAEKQKEDEEKAKVAALLKAEEDRNLKMTDAKMRRDIETNSPAGKAKSCLAKVAIDISIAQRLQVEATTLGDKGMSRVMAEEWKNIFKAHIANMEARKSELSSVAGGATTKYDHDALTAVVTAFQSDAKVFKINAKRLTG